jgi:hypothetical protein
MAPPLSAEIRQACLCLFGRGAVEDPAFLADLTDTDLKRHYREQAKHCHPDRARQLGRHETQLAVEFRRLDRHYKCLRAWLQRRGPPGPRRASTVFAASRRSATRAKSGEVPPHGPRSKARPARPPSQQVHRPPPQGGHGAWPHGPLPQRRLLLAEYLFHRGLIAREHLIDALVWQRRQRPMLGQLAVEWGYLDQQQVKTVLEHKQAGERFGECARRLGLISIFQHFALLGKQKSLQQRIGGYFQQRGLLAAETIDHMVEALQEHNRSVLFRHWQ